MAEDLIEKISLEDTVDEIDTDSEENEDDVKDEQSKIFMISPMPFLNTTITNIFNLTSVN